MRVDLTVGVFVAPESLRPVLNLLNCFAEGRHDWAATPQTVAAAEFYLHEHAPQLASTYANLGRKAMVDAAWSAGPPSAGIRIGPDDLDDVPEDLCRPAVLVVEDLENDGCFVRAIATVFGSEHVLDALCQKWLVISHSGGERLAVVAKEESQRFRKQIRVAALLDSDRWIPGQQTKSHRKAEELVLTGVRVHVLELREAENYVPNRVLRAAGRPRETSLKLELLKRLTPQQRGHFDMKHGFGPKDREPAVRCEQEQLFANLDGQMLRGLRGGFGTQLLQLLESECAKLTPDDFSGLGVAAELRELLSTIEGVI